ncbi:hypothetical protein [Leptospira andrefontaineae]|uniref:Uncharacterized protein n=1 Tax=Leptospira andrefontaineae TaxID=2484976 RepID=A0A4R9GWW6_9LEPT|nr:hypothetical protein [Leptospira andrefontaineae]TGK36269.1 hypothetical protein EHO65_18385 [Leptospira andrefontaineae]
MNQLKIDYSIFSRELVRLVQEDFGVQWNFESVNIGVRGVTCHDDGFVRLNNDAFNEYNDRLWKIEVGGKSWNSWRVTCDPGRILKSQELKYLNPEGEARVISSLKSKKIYRHKPGYHNGHQALIQSGTFLALRDKNKDFKWNKLDKQSEAHGINIHSSGSKKGTVDLSSVGCTVFYSGWADSEWNSYIVPIYAEGEKKPKAWEGFPYIVYDQEEVFDRIYKKLNRSAA